MIGTTFKGAGRGWKTQAAGTEWDRRLIQRVDELTEVLGERGLWTAQAIIDRPDFWDEGRDMGEFAKGIALGWRLGLLDEARTASPPPPLDPRSAFRRWVYEAQRKRIGHFQRDPFLIALAEH